MLRGRRRRDTGRNVRVTGHPSTHLREHPGVQTHEQEVERARYVGDRADRFDRRSEAARREVDALTDAGRAVRRSADVGTAPTVVDPVGGAERVAELEGGPRLDDRCRRRGRRAYDGSDRSKQDPGERRRREMNQPLPHTRDSLANDPQGVVIRLCRGCASLKQRGTLLLLLGFRWLRRDGRSLGATEIGRDLQVLLAGHLAARVPNARLT